MNKLRIRSLRVRGFRSFGIAEQELRLTGELTAIWAPNSKGKSSLAEAFEFLLTGRIVRRELMASGQDEFADSLRNAHLPIGESVYVTATAQLPDGSEHTLHRVLTRDYGKRNNCETRLEIDGATVSDQQLDTLGFTLSQPPLAAPVLAQHTLGYVFSLGPQNRTTYFKTLLDVNDLDALRAEVAACRSELLRPSTQRLNQFGRAAQIPQLGSSLLGISNAVLPDRQVDAALLRAAELLILTSTRGVPAALDARRRVVREILLERRSKTFPIDGLGRTPLPEWVGPGEQAFGIAESFIELRGAVNAETRQLSALFTEALKVPALASVSDPVDCPVCQTPLAMTPARIAKLREHVEKTRGYSEAIRKAKTVLSTMSSKALTLADSAERALPRCISMMRGERRQQGFTVARLRELLPHRPELVGSWLTALKGIARPGAGLKRAASKLQHHLASQSEEPSEDLDVAQLRNAFDRLSQLRLVVEAAMADYEAPSRELETELARILDSAASTTGWQDFLDCTADARALHSELVERATRGHVVRELDQALQDIDAGKEEVLDDKFSEFSDLVQVWWERLRPGEATFFMSVEPRPGTRRTIDFKAGLATTPDRDAPKLRDVIAIFSQSQLHCLGLALFLAKAEHERLGIIILDDPVLSSDEDYKVHFNSTVLEKLLALPMQVVVMTQDHGTWEELETRYRHVGIANAQLFVESPAEGTVIENTSDTLLAKLSRAKSLARGGHPDVRKECGIQLRDAGERFCKEMLVSQARAAGKAAALSDYDGNTLEWLCPRVEPLLGRDASHPGKLGVFHKTVNNACHDNDPPGTAAMTVAWGDLRHFVKVYLGR